MADEDLCRICRGHQEPGSPLYRPCRCSGSIASVHQHCLDFWLSRKQTATCELCHTEIKHKAIYVDRAPRFIPLTKFLAGWFERIRGGRSPWIRLSFVFSVWALALPLLSLWATRFLFYGLYPPTALIPSWTSLPLLCAIGGLLVVGGTGVFALETTLDSIVSECLRFYVWWLEQSSLTSAAALAETLSLEGQVVRLYTAPPLESNSPAESSDSSSSSRIADDLDSQQTDRKTDGLVPPSSVTDSAPGDPLRSDSISLMDSSEPEIPAEANTTALLPPPPPEPPELLIDHPPPLREQSVPAYLTQDLNAEENSDFMELIGLRGSVLRSIFCVALIWVASLVFAFISLLLPYGQGRAWLHASLTALLTAEMSKGNLLPELLPLAVGHMATSLPQLLSGHTWDGCAWSNSTGVMMPDTNVAMDDLSMLLASKMSGCPYEAGCNCQLHLLAEELRRPRFHLQSGRSFSAWSDCVSQLIPDVLGMTAEAFTGREKAGEQIVATLDFSALKPLAYFYSPIATSQELLQVTTMDTLSYQPLTDYSPVSSLLSKLPPWWLPDGVNDDAAAIPRSLMSRPVHKSRDVNFDVFMLFRDFPFYRPLMERLWQREATIGDSNRDSLETIIDVYYAGQLQPLFQLSDSREIDVFLHQGKETPLRAKTARPAHYRRKPARNLLKFLTAQPSVVRPMKATVAALGHGGVTLRFLGADIGIKLPYSLVGQFVLVRPDKNGDNHRLQYQVNALLHPFPVALSTPVWFATVWALGQRRIISGVWLLTKAALAGIIVVGSIALVLDWVERCSGTRELTAAEEEALQRKKRLEEQRRPQELSYRKRFTSLCMLWARPMTRYSMLTRLFKIASQVILRVVKTVKSLVFFILSFEELLAASSLTLLLDTILPIILGRAAISLTAISPWLQIPPEWIAWHLNENFVILCIVAHCVGVLYLNLLAALVFNAYEVVQKRSAESLILDHYALLGFSVCTFAIMGRNMPSERGQSRDVENTASSNESQRLPRTLLSASEGDGQIPDISEAEYGSGIDRSDSPSFETSSQNLCKAFFATASIGDLTQALLIFLTTHVLLLSIIIFTSGYVTRLIIPKLLPLRVIPRAHSALDLHRPWARQIFVTIVSSAQLIMGYPLDTIRESISISRLILQTLLILNFSTFWLRRAVFVRQPMRVEKLSFLSAYVIDACGFGRHLKPQWRRWLHGSDAETTNLGLSTEDSLDGNLLTGEKDLDNEELTSRETAEAASPLEEDDAEPSMVETRVEDESETLSSREELRHNRHVMSMISDMLHGLLRRARHFSAVSQDSSSAGEANGACLWVRRTFRQMDLPEGWVVRELASQVTINLERIYIAGDRVVAVECRRPNEDEHVTFEAAPIDKKEYIMAGVFVARVWTHNEGEASPAKEEVQFQVWMPKTEIPNTDFGHVRFAASKIFLLFQPNVDSNGARFDFPWKARGFYMTTDQRDAGDFQMRYTFRYVVAEGPKQYVPTQPIPFRERLSLLLRAGKPAFLLLLAFVLITALSTAVSVSLGRIVLGFTYTYGTRITNDHLHSIVGNHYQSFNDFTQDLSDPSALNTDLRLVPRFLLKQQVPTAELTDVIAGSIGAILIYELTHIIASLNGFGKLWESIQWLKRERRQLGLRALYAFGLGLFYFGMPLCEGAFFDLFFLRPVATERMIASRWPQWFILGLPAFTIWWGCLNFTEFGVWLSPLIFVGSVEVVDRDTLREIGVLSLNFRSSSRNITAGHVRRLYIKFLARLAFDWLEWLILPLIYVVFGQHIAHYQHWLLHHLLTPFKIVIPDEYSFPFNVHRNFLQLVVLMRVLKWLEARLLEDVRNVHQQVWEKCYLLRKELVDFER